MYKLIETLSWPGLLLIGLFIAWVTRLNRSMIKLRHPDWFKKNVVKTVGELRPYKKGNSFTRLTIHALDHGLPGVAVGVDVVFKTPERQESVPIALSANQATQLARLLRTAAGS